MDIMSMIGFGAGGVTVVPTVASLSHIADTTSVDLTTVVAPATINPGDLLILFDSAYGNAGYPAKVVPTGFTEITSFVSTLIRETISYKICVGNEDGTTITGQAADFNDKVLLQFRGNISISTVTPGDVTTEATINDPAAQTCNASLGTVPLIVFGGYFDGSTITTRTFSPAADAEVTSSTFGYVKYKIYNSSPADVSIDMGDYGGNNLLSSFYLQVT